MLMAKIGSMRCRSELPFTNLPTLIHHSSSSGSVESLSEPFPWLEEEIGVGGVEIHASKSIAWHHCGVLLQGQFDEAHSLLEEHLLLSFHRANLLLLA